MIVQIRRPGSVTRVIITKRAHRTWLDTVISIVLALAGTFIIVACIL